MTDNREEVFKELADVLDKHGITIDSNDSVWIDIPGEATIFTNYEPVSGEFLRKEIDR